jgi:hypothetical protein
VVKDLREARERLLYIKKDQLTSDLIFSWLHQHRSLWSKSERYGDLTFLNLNMKLQGFESEANIDVLDALRVQLVEYLDVVIKNIDSQIVTKSVLQERIARVQDTKLATLLNEFESVKDTAPNLAAVGFRTILTLIIQERAKRVNPTSTLATRLDLAVDPMIKDALQEHIFTPGEEKHLKRFSDGGGKVTFDNITHKPGSSYLIDKSDLEDAINLLNALLAAIIN